MYKWPGFIICFFIACSSSNRETDPRWDERVRNVSITRDIYGVPHIYGKTDADVVFGLMYAQCEESFEKVEAAYLRILGRMSEKQGVPFYYQDLSMKILYDTAAAKKDFENSPGWLKKLLYAFSDGIHYYLHKNPGVKPVLLARFEPWFPLLFNDGAYISGNMGGLEQTDMQSLFKKDEPTSQRKFPGFEKDQLTGSNAFALAPSRSATGNAILFINPHVSFYFRTEVHLVSEEGLNAYGAASWGQFFIYQGFNDALGWMHTSSLADGADLYEENIISKNNKYFFEYEKEFLPVKEKTIVLRFFNNGNIVSDSIPVFYTGHGPVMGKRNGKFLSLKSQNHSLHGLVQSWQRMKSRNINEFMENLSLKTNHSTNTLYADNKGNIAYWHGNFVPKRDTVYNWSLPVNGTTRKTEWKGLHEINELAHNVNPGNGWLQNCNSSPFHAAGNNSLKRNNFPSYMAPEAENYRSVRAVSVFSEPKKWKAEEIIALAFDGHLSMFDTLLPHLIKAYAQLPTSDLWKVELKEPIEELKGWDKKAAVNSIATTLAVFWGYSMLSTASQQSKKDLNNIEMVHFVNKNMGAKEKLQALRNIVNGLERYYNNWKIPWGEINRYQRTASSDQKFSDNKESMPVPFASAIFGCLASYETIWGEGKKQYGVAGNSFVALVEFGKKIRARSIITGGQLFDPSSKHFNDQALMFTQGKLKEVFFYKEDVLKNAERTYKPGE